MEEKSMKGRKILYYFVLIFLLIFTSYWFIKFVLEQKEVTKTKNQLAQIAKIEEKVDKEVNVKDRYDQYRTLFNNDDIVGRIIIDSLQVDSLLVQTNNNSYYLRHLLDGTYNVMGSIFIDYRTDINNSRQINIYGHNSDIYDLPFKKLENYLDKNFFLNNKIIKLETLDGIKNFEIFSVKVLTDDIEHTNVSFFSDGEFKRHIEKLRSNSLYDSSVEVLESDQVLVLQTCLFDNTLGEYLIIIGRKV